MVKTELRPLAYPQDHQRCVSLSRIIHTNDPDAIVQQET
jgi:hypothetical protein